MLTLKSMCVGMGLLMVIFYLPFIFNFKGWKKEVASFLEEKNLVRICGILMLIIAFFLLKVHHTFEKAWPVAVSILGWLTLLKGLVWFWWPSWVKKMWKKHTKCEWCLVVTGLLGLAIGVFYEYIGFYIF